MARLVRPISIAVIIAGLLLGAGALHPAAVRAAGDRTFPVNGPADGTVFDQPSTVLAGSVAHVAYIGGSSLSGPFTVHYAAVKGDADFSNTSFTRDNVLVTPPVSVSGIDTYADARHPKIAFLAPNHVVIFFQAKPSSASDTAYFLYRAHLTIGNNAVTSQDVRRVTNMDITPGDVEDVSIQLVSQDNTARIAYANRPTTSPDRAFRVWYARVGLGLDGSVPAVIGTPIPLSSGDNNTVTGSDGYRPLPSLRLDGSNRAHVAWAANDNVPAGAPFANPAPVYYAMVKDTPRADNRADIAATQVLGDGKRWGHPSVLVPSNSSILVLAADETIPGTAGDVGVVELNPDRDNQDGSPADASGQAGTFRVNKVLSLEGRTRLYRPEAVLDGNGRIHLTGYGSTGTSAVYRAVNVTNLFTTPEFQTPLMSFALPEVSEPPGELPGDYTKASFGYLGGKIVVFWSGLASVGAARNLDVTTVPSVAPPSEESGCIMVRDPRAGESGRIPGALLLLLPAAVLGLRRLVRRHRGFFET